MVLDIEHHFSPTNIQGCPRDLHLKNGIEARDLLRDCLRDWSRYNEGFTTNFRLGKDNEMQGENKNPNMMQTWFKWPRNASKKNRKMQDEMCAPKSLKMIGRSPKMLEIITFWPSGTHFPFWANQSQFWIFAQEQVLGKRVYKSAKSSIKHLQWE